MAAAPMPSAKAWRRLTMVSAIVLTAGCWMPGHAEVELASAHGWSLPDQVDEPDVAIGLDVNYAFGPGLFAYFAEGRPLVGAYVSVRPLQTLAVGWGAAWNGNYDVPRVDVEALLGTWWWDSSPEGHGMLTGLKLVVGHGLQLHVLDR